MTKIQQLNPASMPLQGLHLIEASAGTGKTYNITKLYIRLLLGQSKQPALAPEQILLVTFTEAATIELRDRIYSEINIAYQALLAEYQQQDSDDEFYKTLYAQLEQPEKSLELLDQARQLIDTAAIFTIHGFCQQMLRRHAFASGSLFDLDIIESEYSLKKQALWDFWRTEIYPLQGSLLEAVLNCFATPSHLDKKLNASFNLACLNFKPDFSGISLEQAWQTHKQAIISFKQNWSALKTADILKIIQSSDVSKRSYNKTNTPKQLGYIDEFAASDSMLLPEKLEMFSRASLYDKTEKGTAPEHAIFVEIENLLKSRPSLEEIILQKAYQQIEIGFQIEKNKQQSLSFDDLLNNLHKALHAEQGAALARDIRHQFPTALIDEFQDTDPIQYQIFRSIYKVKPDPKSKADTGLIMIGDPKQAIYSFRGGDIFTYMQAKAEVDNCYTLSNNYRSTQPMVGVVNQLFSYDNAFVYNQSINYLANSAANQHQPIQVDGKPLAAMNLWYLPEAVNKEQYLQRLANSTANEISRLLMADTEIKVKNEACKLEAKDIAILVRSGQEAAALGTALANCQLPYVYLSNNTSVFSTVEAKTLFVLLEAVLQPNNESLVRAALATSIFQLNTADLDEFNQDEQVWENARNEFDQYQQLWLKKGLLPMFHQLLQARNLAAIIKALPQGERQLTDLLHLIELLQAKSLEFESQAGLLNWYREQIENQNSEVKEQQLRLESSKNVISIITIHKSKGLEYPLVFVPFVSASRAPSQGLYHEDDSLLTLDLTKSADSMHKARKELLAEDIRLLYVAVTRAIYSCYLGVASSLSRQTSKSAFAYLLGQYDADGAGQLSQELLDAFIQSSPDIIQAEICDEPVIFKAKTEEQGSEPKALEFQRTINTKWRISSYSALTHQLSHASAPTSNFDYEVAAESALVMPDFEPEQSIFTFPKGARAGTFLHTLFEELDFPKAEGILLSNCIEKELQQAGYEQEWLPTLEQLVTGVLDTDLNKQGMSLRQLKQTDKQVELEFMLAVEQLNTHAWQQLAQRYDDLSAQAPALDFRQVKGMLKGFIDLVFCYQGRYYIADYKSNYLGAEVKDYNQEAMAEAMRSHRYDMQYQIYSLALHRLLKNRLPNYSYEQHMGGVFYLFLRGMQADSASQNGIFFHRPQLEFIEQLDQLFKGVDHD